MAAVPMRIAGKSDKGMPRKVTLTVKFIEGITCPEDKDRVYVYDERTPGLAICVTESGARSFYSVRKVNGKAQRVRLGSYPEISIDQARTLAGKVGLKIAAGIDPMEEKRKARAAGATMGDLWGAYLEKHAKVRKRSWVGDASRYKHHVQEKWETKQLCKITTADVASLHNSVAEATSQTTANRVIVLVSTMFNKAKLLIGYTGENPCKGVSKFRETPRSRFLNGDELPRFIEALESPLTLDVYRDYFTTLLLTGARSSNVLSMEWNELDLSSGTWSIPPEKAKAGDELTVHLAATVVELLKKRKVGAMGKWVFPSPQKQGIHMYRPTKEWKRVLKRAKLSNVRPHDLRRTLGSWQAASGASLHIIGKSLGHKSVATTAIYARLQIDPVRESVNRATDAMQTAVEAARLKAAANAKNQA